MAGTQVKARAIAEAWAEDEAAYAEYERTGEAISIIAIEQWVRSWGTESESPPPAVKVVHPSIHGRRDVWRT